jgi:hypothetical protein
MNTSVVSVGIDVSKAKLDVACMHQDRSVVHQVFSNDVKGIHSLRSFLRRQSGKWQGKQVLSKRGSGYLRKVLFQIGCGLTMHNGDYQRQYGEMRKRGKNHKTCIIAIARKFLRFLFAYYWKRSIPFGASANADHPLSRQSSIEPLRVSPLTGDDRLRAQNDRLSTV